MAKKLSGTSSRIGNLTLKTKYGSLLNCFGIQPVFSQNGIIKQSFFGFVYRLGCATSKLGKMKYFLKNRINDQNEVILKNKFHFNDAEQNVVKTLLNQRTFTFKHNCSLDNALKNNKLKEILYFYLLRIKYYTMMCMGNFVITSHYGVYTSKLFSPFQIQNFQVYLVSEKFLPKNVLILGHTNINSFATPYVSVPIIDKQHFDSVCQLNGISIDDFKIDTSLRYPITQKKLNIFSLYQSYLDNVDIPYWYIETFNNPVKNRQKAYYTTLFFD